MKVYAITKYYDWCGREERTGFDVVDKVPNVGDDERLGSDYRKVVKRVDKIDLPTQHGDVYGYDYFAVYYKFQYLENAEWKDEWGNDNLIEGYEIDEYDDVEYMAIKREIDDDGEGEDYDAR